jgi:hypothetical protein
MFTCNCLFFPATDEVYKSSRFTYESLRFITYTTKPRGNKSHISVSDNVYFTETRFSIGAIFKRRHSATLPLLHSKNMMLIPPVFLLSSRWFTCNLPVRKRSHIIITRGSATNHFFFIQGCAWVYKFLRSLVFLLRNCVNKQHSLRIDLFPFPKARSTQETDDTRGQIYFPQLRGLIRFCN